MSAPPVLTIVAFTGCRGNVIIGAASTIAQLTMRLSKIHDEKTGDGTAMTAPETHLLQLVLGLGIVLPASYAVGRVHQWYTHSLRRDMAFREGYDHASHSMFDLAVQQRAAERQAAPVASAAPWPRRRNTDSRNHTVRPVPLNGIGQPPRSAENSQARLLAHAETTYLGRRRRDASPASQERHDS